MTWSKNRNMFRPPSKRVRCSPCTHVGKPVKGSFLDTILTKNEFVRVVPPKRPVYNQNDYLKLLEKNYKTLGVPYVAPDLPIYVHEQTQEKTFEPELDVPDRVYMRLRILKNGIVRVKLSGTIWDLHNQYYRFAKKPPFKAVVQAYKGHGFSKGYLEQLKKNQEKQKQLAIRIEKVFAKIFEKEPVKKVKKKVEKKKEDEEIVEEPEPEEVEEEVPDDGGMDVEPDLEDEEVVEDEEFMSDGE